MEKSPLKQTMDTIPSLGAQTLGVDLRNTTGMFQTPGYMADSASRTGNSMQLGPAFAMGMMEGVGGIASGLIGSSERNSRQINAQTEYNNLLQAYKDLDVSNLYAGVENQYKDMENVYEDMTVNQQQAEFEKQMFSQQQANIMQGLSAAAGGSGIAGLAQALSNQAQVATQRASASIGMQEAQIQQLQRGEASRLQMAEREGAARAEEMRLAGAETARGLKWDKRATLLGMSQQELAEANRAQAEGQASLWGGVGQVIGGIAGFALGGPMGAMAGSQLGGSLGRSF